MIQNQFNNVIPSVFNTAPKMFALLQDLKVAPEYQEQLDGDIELFKVGNFTAGIPLSLKELHIEEDEIDDSMRLTLHGDGKRLFDVMASLDDQISGMYKRGWYCWRNDSCVKIYGLSLSFESLGLV